MPQVHGEKRQHPKERDSGEEIAKHEALVLALDALLDLALELDWRLRDAAPLFAPRIKFAVFTHHLSPNASFRFSCPIQTHCHIVFCNAHYFSHFRVRQAFEHEGDHLPVGYGQRLNCLEISRPRWSARAACSSGWGRGSIGWSASSISSSCWLGGLRLHTWLSARL